MDERQGWITETAERKLSIPLEYCKQCENIQTILSGSDAAFVSGLYTIQGNIFHYGISSWLSSLFPNYTFLTIDYNTPNTIAFLQTIVGYNNAKY